METRGSIARYDRGTGEYTLWSTSQAPHVHRLLLAAFVLGVPEQKIRIIVPDIGGGFGSKIFVYYDMALMMALSKKLGGRPVKFFEDRSENYLTTTHGRDHITDVEVGATRTERSPRSRSRPRPTSAATSRPSPRGIPTTLYGRMIAGCYKIPNIRVDVVATYTNTAMVDAYRGAGRPEAAYVIERVCDLVADATGVDPAEVRRRNFIQPEDFPYDTGVGMLPVRQRQLRDGARQGARDPSATRTYAPSSSARRDGATASCSASGCRPTSRSAASRRRSGSGFPAKAGGPASGRARTSRCISPARSW